MCDCHLLAAFLSHLASGLIQFLPHVVGERHPGHQADHLKTAWKNLCSFLVWFDSFAAIAAELIHQIDGLSTLRALHVVYGNTSTVLGELLFACSHRFSWPMKRSDGTYYQVCVHCGAEYGYDWDRMQRTAAVPPRPAKMQSGSNFGRIDEKSA
jgi:hypothetical protein